MELRDIDPALSELHSRDRCLGHLELLGQISLCHRAFFTEVAKPLAKYRDFWGVDRLKHYDHILWSIYA